MSVKAPEGNTANWTNKEWTKYEQHENEVKAEFQRLYRADDTFSSMNKQSVLIMIEINRRWRVIAFHTFGCNIKI